MVRRIILTAAATLLLVIGLLPLLSILAKSVVADGRLDLTYYQEFLSATRQWTLMGNSLALAFLVSSLTTLFGVPLGILLGKTDLPFRRFLTILFIIPLLIPPYIMAVSWFDLLGREGLLAGLLGSQITKVTSTYLFGLPGCVTILFTIYLPIPMLLTMAFLRTINPRLEEAARLVSTWPGVIRGITLPLILPGIVLSAMLVFILSLGEFSVPAFLRYDVFPVESFTQFSAFYNFRAATAAAMPLAAFALLLLMAEGIFLREKTYRLAPFPGSRGLPMIEMGRLGKWLSLGAAASCLVLVVMPLAVLVIQSGGMQIYIEALYRAKDSLARSLVYAFAGASLLTILGFFTGYLVKTRALRWWRSVDSLTLFLFALPGTVMGIGLISLWNTPWTNFIYGTPAIIVLGYLAKYTAITNRITVTQLAQMPGSMEEAAQVAGAGWLRRISLIVVPLARRGLLISWLVGYIFCLRDTGITMLVYPAGHDTLPVRIFTLMANGSPQLIAALCVVMLTATLIPAGILWMTQGIIARSPVR